MIPQILYRLPRILPDTTPRCYRNKGRQCSRRCRRHLRSTLEYYITVWLHQCCHGFVVLRQMGSVKCTSRRKWCYHAALQALSLQQIPTWKQTDFPRQHSGRWSLFTIDIGMQENTPRIFDIYSILWPLHRPWPNLCHGSSWQTWFQHSNNNGRSPAASNKVPCIQQTNLMLSSARIRLQALPSPTASCKQMVKHNPLTYGKRYTLSIYRSQICSPLTRRWWRK